MKKGLIIMICHGNHYHNSNFTKTMTNVYTQNSDVYHSESNASTSNESKSNIARFSIVKVLCGDFPLFAIIDNELKKIVCHLVYENGESYCDEMANKMLQGLNSN